MSDSTQFDNEAVLAEARGLLPMERLLGQYGYGPTKPKETWKNFTCPFCQKPKHAGIWSPPDGKALLFKCHGKTCGAEKACDEVGFVMRKAGLSRKEAFKLYLRMAGVKDRRPASGAGSRLPDAAVDALADAEAGGEPPSQVGETVDDVGLVTPPDGPTSPIPPAPDLMDPAEGVSNTLPDVGIVPRGTIERPEEPKEVGEWAAKKGLEAQLEAEQAAEVKAAAGKIIQMIDGEGKPVKQQAPRQAPAPPVVMARPSEVSEIERLAAEARLDFYSQLTLSESDENRLFAKRGLTKATCTAMGFKSNPRSNLELLRGLEKRHSQRVLVEAGLYTWSKAGRCGPSRQFHGWGMAGKKPDGEPDWGWTCPILIPYWGVDGTLLHLRPHKGGPKSSTASRSRCYVARPAGAKDDRKYRRVMVTESEFKAAAVWQMNGPGRAITQGEWECYGACALPGIQMSRKAEVFEDLEFFLTRATDKAKPQVIVAFDSEEKGDPLLPGYKEQKSKRFDTPLYAIYLAKLLHGMGFPAEVAWLPNVYRLAGKADWDGVLAGLLAGHLDVKAELETKWTEETE